jgi:OTT_1508-like deaminase
VETLQSLENVVQDLKRTFAILEKQSTDKARSEGGAEILQKLVSDIYSKLEMSKLSNLLALISPQDSPWSGSAPKRVIRKYQKLAQYVSAASNLRRLVQKFSNWDFEEVKVLAFPKQVSGAESSAAAGFLTRSLMSGTSKEQKSFQTTIETRLKKDRARIEIDVQHVLEEKKCVHAETQLLFYYAENPHGCYRPRVISSNKESCYLCNLFIKTHGQFYCPKSHGVIYTKWRLPTDDEVQMSKESRIWMNQIIDRFNDAIETKIQFCLENGVQKRSSPSESTILSREIYTPSTVSFTETKTVQQYGERNASKEVVSYNLVRPEKRQSQSLSPESSSKHISASYPYGVATERVRQLSTEGHFVQGLPENLKVLSPLNTSSASALLSVDQSSLAAEEREYPVQELSLRHSTPLDVSQRDALRGTPRKANPLCLECPTNIVVAPGTSTRFHTPRLHFEFSHDVPRPTGDKVFTASKDVVLRVEWVSSVSVEDGHKAMDLEAPVLEKENVDCSAVFERQGMILYGKGHTILIQAHMQKANA